MLDVNVTVHKDKKKCKVRIFKLFLSSICCLGKKQKQNKTKKEWQKGREREIPREKERYRERKRDTEREREIPREKERYRERKREGWSGKEERGSMSL